MNRFSSQREPFSRGEKLLFATLPLFLLGFAGSGWWLSRGDETVPITIPAPAPLPSPNGFDFYIAAAGAIRAANPSVDPIDDRRAITILANPKLAAQNYSLARRTAWLGANARGFALVKTATRTPTRYDAASGMRSFATLRQLARQKVIEANTFVMQKRWGAATDSSLDTIQMGYDIARGGPLMARLTGSGLTSIGRDPLFTDKGVPERLTAAQARAAARRLETILASRPGWKEALTLGKWESLLEFQELVKRGNWRALAVQGNPEMTTRERFRSQFLSARSVAERISGSYDASIANIDKPFKTEIPPAPFDPIASNFISNGDYRFQEGREIVPFNTLLLRFALRAYRLENGQFPAALSQLAPRYLKAIPRDYFASGAPFGYKRSGENYLLWSVGPDKIDNGGVPMLGRDGKSGANAWGRFPSLMDGMTGDYVAGKNR